MHYSANDLNRINDLQTTFHWIISFSGPGAANLPSEDLHIRCTSTTVPKRTHEPIEVELHGHKIKRPGMVSYDGEITLNFVDDIDATVMAAFRALEDKLWTADSTGTDDKGKQEYFKNIKFNITMILQDSMDNATQQYNLHDCLLTDLDPGGEMNSENDSFKPAITVQYNWFNWKKL